MSVQSDNDRDGAASEPKALSPSSLLLRKFAKRDDGATAVEFAMVALPFFALLFAILETAVVFFAGQILETGVYNASRLIRTGQAQQSGFSDADFKDEVCANFYGVIDCEDGGLVLDVRTHVNFDVDLELPIDEDGNFTFTPQYDPGQRNDIVVVRAFIEWPTIVPALGNDLSNLSNGNRLIAAAAAFRNEPFN